MQDPRMPMSGEIMNSKPRKKKLSASRAALITLQGNDVREFQQVQAPLRTSQKASKRNFNNEGSPVIRQQEWSNSDSLPDSSTTSGNEYRALRRKYLLLEEESFGLGRELKVAEGEVKTLEDEKLDLLDKLVVLEGLIDPSEVHPNGLQSL